MLSSTSESVLGKLDQADNQYLLEKVRKAWTSSETLKLARITEQYDCQMRLQSNIWKLTVIIASLLCYKSRQSQTFNTE